jgi:uncharacterized damage-inducible protein DinB
MLEKLKYPVGKFQKQEAYTLENSLKFIEIIEQLPNKLNTVLKDLSEDEYELPYRPDGWNIRQVIHHLADSHMNAFVRFKLALSEENPTIKPYDENAFVQFSDCGTEYIPSALSILEGLHKKWAAILNNINQSDYDKTYFHPESGRVWALKDVLALYAWHCDHHLAHIYQALQYRGTF